MVIFYDDMTWHQFHLWIGVDRQKHLRFIRREQDVENFNLEEIPGTYVRSTESVQPVVQQLLAYFSGELKNFQLHYPKAVGTPFQEQIWATLRQIPYGETRTYQDIARKIGKPTACQAVGQAISRNPYLIVTPCHRVIGKNGHLIGFSSGLDMKKALLNLEQGLTSLNV